MPRSSRWQVVLSAVVAGTLGLQALAFCGIWVVLAATSPDCCPSHKATSTAVITSCCAAADQDGQTATRSTSVVNASDLRTITLVPAQPPSVDSRVAYQNTLPVAARGHAPLRLPALLI